MKLKPIAIALALQVIGAGSAFASDQFDKQLFDYWYVPKDINAEVSVNKQVYLYDSNGTGLGSGIRLNARWAIPRVPDNITFLLGYVDLKETTYDFPEYNPNNKHSQAIWEDMMNVAEGQPIRDGDRRMAGFPANPHKIVWKPRGIEFGAAFRLPVMETYEIGLRASAIYDLSPMPEITGITITNAKVKRNLAQSFGLSLHNNISKNFTVGIAYDRMMFTSYIEGDPQAWNEAGGKFFYGKRSYDTLGLIVSHRFF
jgi:hypothetical protein